MPCEIRSVLLGIVRAQDRYRSDTCGESGSVGRTGLKGKGAVAARHRHGGTRVEKCILNN